MKNEYLLTNKESKSGGESFSYAAEILSKPGNLLLFYPQAKLESSHIRHIHFEDGLNQIIPQIKGKCQLVWSSNIMEYFESTKPSLYYNLLDCVYHQKYQKKEDKHCSTDSHNSTGNFFLNFCGKG